MKSLLTTLFVALFAQLAVAQNLSLSLTFTAPGCNGFTDGTATVQATGGTAPYAYSWSNGQSGQTNLGIAAGTYTLTVTDQSSVTAVGTVTVTQPAPIGLSVSQSAPNCGLYAPITANTLGGIVPLSYAWNTGATTQTIIPTAPGNVFLTVTDSRGCAEANTYYVPVQSQIFTAFATLAPTCAGGNNGSATPNIIGNYTPITWQWSTGTHASQALTGVVSGTYGITITDAQGCSKVEQVFVPTQAPVQAMTQMTNALCFGTTSGVGKAFGFGGVNPYTFKWSTGNTDPIIQNLPAGTYTVTVTDGNGCTASATGIVTEPPVLTNTVVSITPACGNTGGATVQPAGGTPPYNIVWNGGLYTGTTISGVPAGNYYVCVFDANHCQLDLNLVIPGGPGLDVNLTIQKAECVGVNDGVATATVANGSGNYQYNWSTGLSGSPVVNGLAAGQVVSVTVTDLVTGCKGADTITITSHQILLVQVTDVDVLCASDPTGSATATTLNGTQPIQYIWALPNGGSSTNPTITGLTAGAYAVTATDAKGCTAIGVADIGATGTANPLFIVQTVECEGNLVKVKIIDQSNTNAASITDWNWTFAWGSGSASYIGQVPPVLTIPANATLNVQLSITAASGCTGSANQDFVIGAQPIVSIEANGPSVNCDGGPVQFTVTGAPNYTYTWLNTTGLTFLNNNPLTVEANPSSTTTYQLVASFAGCLDTVSVNVPKITPFEVSLQNSSFVVCDTTQNLVATLSVPVTGMNITWLNAAGNIIGSNLSQVVPATSTITPYTVVVTDSYGCSESATATVMSQAVDINATILLVNSACTNSPVQAQAVNLDPSDILIYNWTANSPNVTISDPISPTPTLTAPLGNYVVTLNVVNQYNCTATLTAPISYTEGGSLAGQISSDLCNGLQVQFNNTSSATGTWSFGDNTTSIVADPLHLYTTAGQYIVTFTPNEECLLPFIDTIQVQATPAVNAGISSALQSCEGAATFVFTDMSQGSANLNTWQWTFQPGGQVSNVQNPSITFTQQGTITATLLVTDINGCSDTTASIGIPVNFINSNLDGTQDVCEGVSVAINPNFNPLYTYNWSATPPDPTLNPTSANPSVMPAVPTQYAVTITNGNCNVVQTAAVDLNPAAIVVTSRDTVVCSAAPLAVLATSPNAGNFTWSNSPNFTNIIGVGSTIQVVPTTTGMNYVQATTDKGCKGIDSILVQLGATNLDFLAPQTPVCNGTTAIMEVINNNPSDVLTYNWSGGLSPLPVQTIAPTSNTSYTVTVTNQYLCKDTLTASFTVLSIALNLEVTGKDTICPGEEAQLLATPGGGSVYSYDWTPAGDLDDSEINNPIATPTETTTYTVTVTDASGCTTQGTVTVAVMQLQCAFPYIFVPNAFTPDESGRNDFFRVRATAITEITFVVWDRWGEKMYETNDINHIGWDGYYKGVASPPDAYAWYVRVRCGDGQLYENKGNVTLLR